MDVVYGGCVFAVLAVVVVVVVVLLVVVVNFGVVSGVSVVWLNVGVVGRAFIPVRPFTTLDELTEDCVEFSQTRSKTKDAL